MSDVKIEIDGDSDAAVALGRAYEGLGRIAEADTLEPVDVSAVDKAGNTAAPQLARTKPARRCSGTGSNGSTGGETIVPSHQD